MHQYINLDNTKYWLLKIRRVVDMPSYATTNRHDILATLMQNTGMEAVDCRTVVRTRSVNVTRYVGPPHGNRAHRGASRGRPHFAYTGSLNEDEELKPGTLHTTRRGNMRRIDGSRDRQQWPT